MVPIFFSLCRSMYVRWWPSSDKIMMPCVACKEQGGISLEDDLLLLAARNIAMGSPGLQLAMHAGGEIHSTDQRVRVACPTSSLRIFLVRAPSIANNNTCISSRLALRDFRSDNIYFDIHHNLFWTSQTHLSFWLVQINFGSTYN